MKHGGVVVVYQVHVDTVSLHQLKRRTKLKTGNNIQSAFGRLLLSFTGFAGGCEKISKKPIKRLKGSVQTIS